MSTDAQGEVNLVETTLVRSEQEQVILWRNEILVRAGCAPNEAWVLAKDLGVDLHEAVDLIVSIERTDRGRQVRDVLHVESFSAGQYQTQSYAPKEERHVA